MKSLNKGAITAKLAALIGLIFLTGCGSGGSSSTPIGNLPGGSAGIPGTGGCVPLHAPIPFSGQNIHFDSYNLVGGYLPPQDAWPTKPAGTVVLGGGSTGGIGAGQLYGSSMDGTIQMTVFPMNQQVPGGQYPSQYPSPYTAPMPAYNPRANVQGTLTLSAAVQQEIMYYVGAHNVPMQTYPGQPVQQPYQQAQPCVSGIAFNMGYQVNMPYGKVYLYLNRTQHGIVLYF